MDTIYLIINESFPVGMTTPMTEVVQPAWRTLQDALQGLNDIASEYGLTLEDEETSVFLPVEGTHLESDEYYIIEMEVLDHG